MSSAPHRLKTLRDSNLSKSTTTNLKLMQETPAQELFDPCVPPTLIGSHAEIPRPRQELSLERSMTGVTTGLRSIKVTLSKLSNKDVVLVAVVVEEEEEEDDEEEDEEEESVLSEFCVPSTLMGSQTEIPSPRHELSLLRSTVGLIVGSMTMRARLSRGNVGRDKTAPVRAKTRMAVVYMVAECVWFVFVGSSSEKCARKDGAVKIQDVCKSNGYSRVLTAWSW